MTNQDNQETATNNISPSVWTPHLVTASNPLEPEDRKAAATIWGRLARVQAQCAEEEFPKTGENKFFGYKYVMADDLFRKIAPMLAKEGLILLIRETPASGRLVPELKTDKGKLVYFYEWEYQWMCDGMSAPLPDNWLKHSCMAPYKDDKSKVAQSTMMEKYFLRGQFLIATGERDMDSDEGTHAGAGVAVPESERPAPKGPTPAQEKYDPNSFEGDVILFKDGKLIVTADGRDVMAKCGGAGSPVWQSFSKGKMVACALQTFNSETVPPSMKDNLWKNLTWLKENASKEEMEMLEAAYKDSQGKAEAPKTTTTAKKSGGKKAKDAKPAEPGAGDI